MGIPILEGMILEKKLRAFQMGFWVLSSFLLAGIYSSFVQSFAQAWLLATMLLPGALFARATAPWAMRGKVKKAYYWIYVAIGTMWLEYAGAIVAYWYLFELDPDQFPKVLINPLFSVFWMAALILGEIQLAHIFGLQPKADEAQSITFTSNRKTITLAHSDIIYIESLDRITQVHTVEGTALPCSQSISSWEENLNWPRIHRSFLINPAHVHSFNQSTISIGPADHRQELRVGRAYKDQLNALKSN